MDNFKKCDYCNVRDGLYIIKNGKFCCKKTYQSCPSVTQKSGVKISDSLKEQYKNNKRISYFRIFNDGSFWKNKQHKEETKKKIIKK
jgi:uncharacterized Fe-S cluster-containing MiaB family protein